MKSTAVDLSDYPAREREFESILEIVLVAELYAMAAFAGDSASSWRGRAGIPDLYHGWVEESFSVLESHGHIVGSGEGWTLANDVEPSRELAWKQWDSWRATLLDAALQKQAQVAEVTLRALPRILLGRIQAPEVLFPRGSVELVEDIYKNNALADYFNNALAHFLADYVKRRAKLDPAARIRVLEIGAGTGGSTQSIVAGLAEVALHVEEYAYTDLSKALVLHGQQQYGPRASYLRFITYDVEKPPQAQGISAGSYDVVVAGNVLHATRSMRRTIRNVKALLKRRGVLLLNELTVKRLFVHLTFGLTEGWWRFDDPELRLAGTPSLSPEGWLYLLETEGFGPIVLPVEEAASLGQQIIAAESDGIVRESKTDQSVALARAVFKTKAPIEQPTAPRSEIKAAVIGAGQRVDKASLESRLLDYLRQTVSELMKVRIEEIDAEAELSDFGFDSISFTSFSNFLNKELRLELTPSVFFENPTLAGLAAYLVSDHAEAIGTKFQSWAAPRDSANELEPAILMEEPSACPADEPIAATRNRFLRGPEPAPVSTDPIGELRQNQVLDPSLQISAAAADGAAIIGISGCFPSARDPEALWQLLLEGRGSISEVPRERWPLNCLYDDSLAKPPGALWGGFIEGVDEFDPLFFGISPGEAELMDPQQRLLMTHVWKAIEDAGYSPQSLSGTNTAILAGTSSSGYGEIVVQARKPGRNDGATGKVPSVGANRISYLLNLHGPSEPIETACSSSLVAIHRGRQLIESGQCEMAIVGGVSTLVSLDTHLSFGRAGFLSEDGCCRPFSAQANGYVRSEGAGFLVLKSLRAAERDGDHIYGVVIGSAENHGGRAASFTAPNPKAQAEVIAAAYDQAGIDCRTVTYIEAHGTGTPLGDPIEIEGLKRAFGATSGEGSDAHCGLGSIKSNIGHMELAAGVAGVIKVLLQLRHKTLVGSLHCEQVNPYLHLEGSPFYLVRENQPWVAALDQQGQALPRRAGVSSFGFGGVNAHVLLEEYVAGGEAASSSGCNGPALVVLSARSEERLLEQARQLAETIREQGWGDERLPDLAYTLQVGREAMEHRIAMAVGNMAGLVEKLEAYVAGRQTIEDFHRGEVRGNKDVVAAFKGDQELQDAMEKWMERGKYSKLLALWAKGLEVDWTRLYKDAKRRRMALPGYPFARERYWIEADVARREKTHGAAALHPLVHVNVSDFSAQRYRSSFTGEEFFLADHVVNGEKMLPGVAYLEMVRAAIADAASARPTDSVLELRNAVWSTPFVAENASRPLQVTLTETAEQEIDCEVTSEFAGEQVLHFQGCARWIHMERSQPADVEILEATMTLEKWKPEQVYAACDLLGLSYGPAFRTVLEIRCGLDGVLVELRLPERADEWVIDPSMLDGALQGCVAFVARSADAQGRPPFPLAMDSLRVLRPYSRDMLAWVRYASGGRERNGVIKVDVDLYDTAGNVCLEMRGFATRSEPARATVLDVPACERLIDDVAAGRTSVEEALESLV